MPTTRLQAIEACELALEKLADQQSTPARSVAIDRTREALAQLKRKSANDVDRSRHTKS